MKFSSVIFHSVLYLFIDQLKVYRLLSTFHSIESLLGVLLYFLGIVSEETYISFFLLATTVYSVIDTYLILNTTKSKEIIFHHIVLFIGTVSNYPLIYIQLALLSEFTTIFLNYCSYIIDQRKKGIVISHTSNILFVISTYIILIGFVILRDINLTCICWNLVKDYGFGVHLLCIPFTSLNYYWTYLLYNKSKELKKKNE